MKMQYKNFDWIENNTQSLFSFKVNLSRRKYLKYFLVFQSFYSHFCKHFDIFSVTQNRPFCRLKMGDFHSKKKSPQISFCRPFGDKSPHLVTLALLLLGLYYTGGYPELTWLGIWVKQMTIGFTTVLLSWIRVTN
jgi:hypothetical protein